MDRLEHLLVILGEESAEIAQDCAKALRFGLHDSWDSGASNIQRIDQEFNDLIAVATMINEEMGGNFLIIDQQKMSKKRAKVEKYLKYSQELGTLKEELDEHRNN